MLLNVNVNTFHPSCQFPGVCVLAVVVMEKTQKCLPQEDVSLA